MISIKYCNSIYFNIYCYSNKAEDIPFRDLTYRYKYCYSVPENNTSCNIEKLSLSFGKQNQ